ncbi:MAG TPA: hypothetical protein VM364_10960 [Vicinamibacterales bacterium]|nr:hypothetical protein [Vicinamibacterales bacterium]
MSRPLGSNPLSALALLVVLASPSESAAQVWVGSAGPKPGSVEITAGGAWNAGQDLASRAATLTPNPGTGSSGFQLFTSDASLEPTLGANAAVAVYVTRRIAVEGAVRLARPQLRVRLGNDFEGAPPTTATTTLNQYVFTGSLLYHLGEGRVAPFVAAGAGHVRDLHGGNELVETGTEYHGKLGLKMWAGSRRRIGLRAEAGVSMIDGGFSFEERTRAVPIAMLGLSFRF